MAGPYIFACPIVPYVLKKYSKINVMIFSLILVSALSTLFGPSKILNYPDELYLIVIGFITSGFACAFCFIPACPEMLESAQLNLNTVHPKLNDIVSGIFNLSFGIGTFLGP